MGARSISIIAARSSDDIADVRRLFLEYAAQLRIDLSFQGFDAELGQLPGCYSPPGGALLLARNRDGAAIGCVAMRPLEPPSVCELKRLYVTPAGRGQDLGRKLVSEIVEAATVAGYREMRLDTLSDMAAARAIYAAAGFLPIGAYYDTPLAGTVFMAKRLNRETCLRTAP